MGTFNIFLGSAVRSIGDITLMRKAGRQIARVRLRTIKNPRTEAQATQRNFVAPVIRFFGEVHTVLRGSFQGMSAEESYNAFQRVNINLAKSNGWFLLKGTSWYPMPYQLSRGTIMPVTYTLDTTSDDHALAIALAGSAEDLGTIGRLSARFISAGYQRGDIVTILLARRLDDGSFAPQSVQFALNAQSTQPLSGLLPAGVGYDNDATTVYLHADGDSIAAGAVIIARRVGKRWLRSTQYLAVDTDILSHLTSETSRDDAIASYMAGGSDEGGGVYPGGDGVAYNVTAYDGRALLFYGGAFDAQIETISALKYIKVRPTNVDNYYYILKDDDYPIGTSSNTAATPATWRRLNVHASGDVLTNYIPLTQGNRMYEWLLSIGVLPSNI